MLLNAYTLHDSKTLTYSPPFWCSTHGQAVRMVQDLTQDQNNMVGRHPSDFVLYCIGRYDDASGTMLPAENREHVADALSLAPARPTPLFPELAPQPAANGQAK